MQPRDINILSIAPYRFLPLKNGGHQAIAKLHHYIGLLANDHVISTKNNDDSTFAFHLHKVFPDKPLRYFPGYGLNAMLHIGEDIKCTHIICEHPYMALSAMTVAHKLHIPWYIRSHNIESERFRDLGKPWWPILSRYESYAMRRANGIFFITEEDAEWAKKNYKLSNDKCHIVPFGTDLQAPPIGHEEARRQLAAETNIDSNIPWLYFLGALDYPPNEEAVRYILDHILPGLLRAGIKHELLIAGKGLDKELQQKIAEKANMHYMGFVPDLGIFLKACNIMLNPVLKGGGIKTKAVEALGYNKTVVSTSSGAAGLIPGVCGDKLLIAPDNDWESFVQLIQKAVENKQDTPASFYETYYHGAIAEKVIDIMRSDAH